MINSNADALSKLGAQTSLLELQKRKASSHLQLSVVPDGLAMHLGSQLFEGPGVQTSSLFSSVDKSLSLFGSLVEESLDSELPVLSLVSIGELVVVLHHFII